MAPFLLLLVLLAEAASDLIEVVYPGDDVTLECKADNSSVIAVKWSRADLEPDYVLLYRDGRPETDDQHPSFKDRVELVDGDEKDGDVSLTLKNVNINDAGTYECRVRVAAADPISTIRTISTISTIHLQVTDLIMVVHPGDDVILPCRAPDPSIRAVEWIRPDLDPDTVLFYRDGHPETGDQHPSFKDRVDVVDRGLKDGDVSLILKNVNINDAGTYKCRVPSGGSRRKKRATIDSEPIRIIRTIRLQVTGPKDGPSSPGLAAGVAVGLVLVAVGAAVAGVLMYKRQKRPGQPDAAGDKQPGETTPLENWNILLK